MKLVVLLCCFLSISFHAYAEETSNGWYFEVAKPTTDDAEF